jgi:hypothetical protein
MDPWLIYIFKLPTAQRSLASDFQLKNRQAEHESPAHAHRKK